MSTIKQDRIDLERLLNGIDPIGRQAPSPVTQDFSTAPSPSTVVDAAPPAESVIEAKAFEYDYDSVKKGLRKRARKTIIEIIKHIMSDETMLEDPYVQNKMEQDIDILADLYMQQDSSEVMQKALLESVSRGNMMPRMFEVYNQMTNQAQSINKQVFDTEQRLRKTYLDIKYEIEDRRMAKNEMSMNEAPQLMQKQGGGMIVTSTKTLIESAKEAHIKKLQETKVMEIQ